MLSFFFFCERVLQYHMSIVLVTRWFRDIRLNVRQPFETTLGLADMQMTFHCCANNQLPLQRSISFHAAGLLHMQRLH